jgi:carbon storage regulator
MLILSVKEGERVQVGDNITLNVIEIRGKQIKLGFQAPDDVLILRHKLAKKEELANNE